MAARLAPEPWQLAPTTDQRTWSIGDLKDAMREMAQEAQLQALHLERDRPYSSPPPSIHPVWSDALRAESMQLRDEGVHGTQAHPWEVSPAAWPSADTTLQAELLAASQERQEWLQLAQDIGETPDTEMVDALGDHPGWGQDAGWGVESGQIQTARDYMLTYGHAGMDFDAQESTLTLDEHLQAYGQRQTSYDDSDDVRMPTDGESSTAVLARLTAQLEASRAAEQDGLER